MADIELINELDLALNTTYSVTKAASNTLVAKYNAALGKSEGILVFSMSPGVVNTMEGKSNQLTEQEMGALMAMTQQFAEKWPHFKGPVPPRESVLAQLKVIERATVEDFGGAFVSHYGNKEWL